jgi:hypothetical protein
MKVNKTATHSYDFLYLFSFREIHSALIPSRFSKFFFVGHLPFSRKYESCPIDTIDTLSLFSLVQRIIPSENSVLYILLEAFHLAPTIFIISKLISFLTICCYNIGITFDNIESERTWFIRFKIIRRSSNTYKRSFIFYRCNVI